MQILICFCLSFYNIQEGNTCVYNFIQIMLTNLVERLQIIAGFYLEQRCLYLLIKLWHSDEQGAIWSNANSRLEYLWYCNNHLWLKYKYIIYLYTVNFEYESFPVYILRVKPLKAVPSKAMINGSMEMWSLCCPQNSVL